MPLETGSLLLFPKRSGGYRLHYRRPELATLLVGRTIDDAEHLTTELHPDCGCAHGVAFAEAITMADGVVVSTARRTAWDLLILIEQAEAMVRRVALDLPQAIGELPRPRLAKPALQAVLEAREAIGLPCARGTLSPRHGRLPQSLARLGAAIDALICEHEANGSPSLTVADAAAQQLVDEAWAAPREIADCLAEVVLDGDKVADEPALALVADGDGVGTAMTARGRLTTRLTLRQGDVGTAAWTTPTDRLFGPAGVAQRLLGDWAGGLSDLNLLMTALDPCVAWRVLPSAVDA